jgi:hypothetical protein
MRLWNDLRAFISESFALSLDLPMPSPERRYRASPNEVTSRSMVDALRRNDFIYGVVVTPFDEAL